MALISRGKLIMFIRKKYYGKDYQLIQAHLLEWYVSRGHSELEFVVKFARLFELHHKNR